MTDQYREMARRLAGLNEPWIGVDEIRTCLVLRGCVEPAATELARWALRKVRDEQFVECLNCGGTGLFESGTITCRACNGAGEVRR